MLYYQVTVPASDKKDKPDLVCSRCLRSDGSLYHAHDICNL
jgi:hypothetical protein